MAAKLPTIRPKPSAKNLKIDIEDLDNTVKQSVEVRRARKLHARAFAEVARQQECIVDVNDVIVVYVGIRVSYGVTCNGTEGSCYYQCVENVHLKVSV